MKKSPLIVYVDAIVSEKTGRHLFDETCRGLLLSRELSELQPDFQCWILSPERGESPSKIFQRLAEKKPWAVIFSGSEKSVTHSTTDPWVKEYLESLQKYLSLWKKEPRPSPILGICFAHQAIAHVEGGEVRSTGNLRVGPVLVQSPHAASLEPPQTFIAFHEDQVTKKSDQWRTTHTSDYCPYQGLEHWQLPLRTVQFHPEMNEKMLLQTEDPEYWSAFSSEDLKRQDGEALLKSYGDWIARVHKASELS